MGYVLIGIGVVLSLTGIGVAWAGARINSHDEVSMTDARKYDFAMREQADRL